MCACACVCVCVSVSVCVCVFETRPCRVGDTPEVAAQLVSVTTGALEAW